MTSVHETVSPIRVVLADDHEVVRMGLRALLSRIAGVEVVGEAGNGEDLVRMADSLSPDIVLTDLGMPQMDGIEAIARIHEQNPQIKLIVLSMHEEVELARNAIDKGACGYLMKNTEVVALEYALRTVMSTGSYFSPQIAQRLLTTAPGIRPDELTERQTQILKLLAQGLTSKQIAFELGLSSKTVDVHRSRIMERLGLRDLASLTRYAVRTGLISA
ncbi:MAG: response regulator transcription factor [Ramlibacter sp.]